MLQLVRIVLDFIEQIAPLFIDFIDLQNVHFPIEFWDFFNNQKQQ